MIRIILAEDHNIVRNGIKNLLEREKEFFVVGEASNGQEVLALLDKGIEADVVLTDINMPVMSGIEMTQKIRDVKKKVKIAVLSMLDHERYLLHAFQAGADAYLLKNISADELVFAIRHIHVDGRYICSELALRFLDRLLRQPDRVQISNETGIDFSEREIEILVLMADGLTNHEIAERLYTSKRTVEGHRQSLLDKTGTRNSAALTRYAILNGLIN